MRNGRRAHRSGAVIAIGGAEDKTGPCRVLREFVKLSGGSKARLLVITVASEDKSTGRFYTKVFRKLGAARVHVIDVLDREGERAKKALDELETSTGVFFTGGSQLALTTMLGGTRLDRRLHERSDNGLVIGGTSAGAAFMSDTMIMQGTSRINPRKGVVDLHPGLEFVRGAIIDTHFSERGRHGRLLTAVAENPRDLGLGIDEDTAALFRGRLFSVLGRGSVTVVDIGGATYDNLSELSKDESLGLHNVKVHVLPSGHVFDMGARRPLPRAMRPAAREPS